MLNFFKSTFCHLSKSVLIPTLLILTTACSSLAPKPAAVAKPEARLEMFGLQRRDQLKQQVEQSRDSQILLSKNLKAHLEQLKALLAVSNGKFEAPFATLSDSMEQLKQQSTEVQTNINTVESSAKMLFSDWEKDTQELRAPELKAQSAQSLVDTKTKYALLSTDLKSTEKLLGPAVGKLSELQTQLRKKLDAKGVLSLQGTSMRTQVQVELLLKDLEKSIAASNKFINELGI